MSWIGAIILKIVIAPAGETAKTRFLGEQNIVGLK
jgi:hypothetical protein